MTTVRWPAVLLLVAALWRACPPPVWAGEASPGSARPRIGLVLSGGGARGAAHVGVLKVLEALRIPVDCIAATSMGSAVGGLYASGYSPQQLDSVLVAVDWTELLNDRPPRRRLAYRNKRGEQPYADMEIGFEPWRFALPRGLVAGQDLDFLIKKLTLPVWDIGDFDQLNIPFRAVATDIGTGGMVVLGSGSLAEAILASLAVPGVFAPREVDGRLLMDGGLVRSLPVDVVRRMGADVIIAVQVTTPRMDQSDVNSGIDVPRQAFLILLNANVSQSIAKLTAQDVLVAPDLEPIGSTEFAEVRCAIALGEQGARAAADSLRRFSLPVAEYERWRTAQRRRDAGPPMVDSISLVHDDTVPAAVIRRHVSHQPGDILNLDKLRQDLYGIYQLGAFEIVTFALARVDSKVVLQIMAREKPWGTDVIRFGMTYSDDLHGRTALTLRGEYSATWLNRYGASWSHRLAVGRICAYGTEFRQPLGYSRKWYVTPSVQLQQEWRDHYSGPGDPTHEYRLRTFGLAVECGRALGRWGRVYARAMKQWTATDLTLGAAETWESAGEADVGCHVAAAGIDLDRLDAAYFPRSGMAASVEFMTQYAAASSGVDCRSLQFACTQAISRGAHTLRLGLNLASSLNTGLPYYQQHALGGFLHLSGYRPRELLGDWSALGRLVYYRPVVEQAYGFGTPVFAGASLEAGDTWVDAEAFEPAHLHIATAGFLGTDTFFGPAAAGAGLAHDLGSPAGSDAWSWSLFVTVGQGF